MASDYTTGLVSRDDLLEWTTLQRNKDRLSVVAARRTEWRLETEEAVEEQPPPLLAPKTAKTAPKVLRLPGQEEVPEEGDAPPTETSPKVLRLPGADPADASETPSTGELLIRVPGAEGDEPPGRPGDVGTVRTPELFRDAAAGIRGDVAVGLSSYQMLIRVIDLPPVEPAELASMVELQIDKFSPFPVEAMVVSHEVIKRTDENCRVLVAAARQTLVDGIGETLDAVGVDPVRVDAAILGWWRLLRDAHALEEGTRHVVVILDGVCRDIAVFQDDLPVVVRSLSLEADAPEEAVARDLAEEVSSTLMSLELEHGVAAHCSVAVWHRGDAPDWIRQEIETVCGCPVSTHSLDDLPPVSEGLARRQADGDGHLDLTPQSWRVTEKARLFKQKMAVAAGTIFGVWVLGMGGLFGGLAMQNVRLSNLRAEAEEWKGPAKAVGDLRRRVSVIRQYTDRRSSALECLREICLRDVLPDGVELTQFSYRKKDVLVIAGQASVVGQVYAFKRKLDASELFGDVTLEGPRRDPRRNKQVFEMDIRLLE